MAGIYLHIPFCKRRCIYCDFYSTVQEEKKDAYVQALCKELEIRRHYIEKEPIETIYFGGGTPSQLDEKAFKQIFDCIARTFDIDYSPVTLNDIPAFGTERIHNRENAPIYPVDKLPSSSTKGTYSIEKPAIHPSDISASDTGWTSDIDCSPDIPTAINPAYPIDIPSSETEQTFRMSHCKEITLEANPDDLSEEYVQMLRRLPFNRISIGIQTFHDPTLQLLQRRHTAQQAIDAVHRCQDAGFQNISIDLIYGLPNETDETWQADLQQAINLKVQHISAYHLIYEEGTPLWNLKAQHQVSEVEEEKSLAFFTQLIDTLSEAGYEQYEISNFCLPGYYSRHNSGYWREKKYIGCGPSAHSYNGISRQWNKPSLDEYIRQIEKGIVPFEEEKLNRHTRYNDRIITSIRTTWGLSLSKLRSDFGEILYHYCLQNACPHIEHGMLEIKKDTLRLTRQGIFISDGIMSDLLWVDDE